MSRANRYLVSNFLMSFTSVFATLFVILAIVFFLQVTKISSYIEISGGELAELFSYTLPQLLAFCLPISFFVSVAMSFFRLSKESESTVLFTLGFSPKRIAATFLGIATLLSAFLVFNATFLIPAGFNLNESFIVQKRSKMNLNLRASQLGQKFGEWMIFIEKERLVGEKKVYEDISLYTIDKGLERLVVAKEAFMDGDGSRVELVLKNGQMYDMSDQNLWHVSNFDKLSFRVLSGDSEFRALGTFDYWANVFRDQKRVKDITIYGLLSLFPLATVLFGLSFGIVTYRYEKGIIYGGIFVVLAGYFVSMMLLAKTPIVAVGGVFLTSFVLSVLYFKFKILRKY